MLLYVIKKKHVNLHIVLSSKSLYCSFATILGQIFKHKVLFSDYVRTTSMLTLVFMCVCTYVGMYEFINTDARNYKSVQSRRLCVLSLYEFMVMFKQHMKLHLHLKTEPRRVYILGIALHWGVFPDEGQIV